LLWLYQRVFFGTVTNEKNAKLHDLTPREVLTFAPLIVMAFWIGLYPKPFFQILEQPVKQIVQTVQPPNNNAPVNAQAGESMGAPRLAVSETWDSSSKGSSWRGTASAVPSSANNRAALAAEGTTQPKASN